MLGSIWTILWICLCLIIFMSVLEAIIRRIKMSQMARAETALRTHIRADQFHIFTLQPISSDLQVTRTVGIQPTPQQQQQILRQQEIDASNDPPPKYEDVVRSTSVSIPVSVSSSPAHRY